MSTRRAARARRCAERRTRDATLADRIGSWIVESGAAYAQPLAPDGVTFADLTRGERPTTELGTDPFAAFADPKPDPLETINRPLTLEEVAALELAQSGQHAFG